MQDVPGSYDDEALQEAILRVRELKYNTHVPSKGIISSGGVDFFTGGIKRTAHPSAKFGIHSWVGGDGITAQDYKKTSKVHISYLRLYENMGISKEFYWLTIESALFNDMYWMTEEEVKTYLLN